MPTLHWLIRDEDLRTASPDSEEKDRQDGRTLH